MNPPIAFGTDGVRGPAGQWPLTAAGASLIGRAVARWSDHGKVIVGRDTRASSPTLSEAILAGVVEGGGVGVDAGVVPTAAVSCAVVAEHAAAGIMVTASHNPWADNGVKILAAGGTKPTPKEIAELEALFARDNFAEGGQRLILEDGAAAWRHALPVVDLSGLHILLDCANGAAALHAPAVLEGMGAALTLRGCSPNGRNINDGVGALHPPTDIGDADLAICFDGDADRIAMVSASQGPLDGDDLLWMLAQQVDGPVVGTVMTNGGLERALGGRLLRSKVGDRYVAAEMRRSGAKVGAETSGHVLFSDGMPTGDGLYAALRILKGPDGRALRTLPVKGWARLPTTKRNIRFSGERRPISALRTPDEARAAGHRVIVRYSGTEPVFRILVEGEAAEMWVTRIANEFQG
ncbi:MAG: phosphoglucosamine mutase [Myxococcota bacterium]